MDKQESLNKAIIEQKKAISRLCASQDMCKNMLLFAYEKEAVEEFKKAIELNNSAIADAMAALLILERELLL
jgi:hypothetical protein